PTILHRTELFQALQEFKSRRRLLGQLKQNLTSVGIDLNVLQVCHHIGCLGLVRPLPHVRDGTAAEVKSPIVRTNYYFDAFWILNPFGTDQWHGECCHPNGQITLQQSNQLINPSPRNRRMVTLELNDDLELCELLCYLGDLINSTLEI